MLVTGAGGALAFAVGCSSSNNNNRGNGSKSSTAASAASATAAVASAAAASATAAVASATPKPGGTYKTAQTGDLGILDPQNAFAAITQNIVPVVYSYLQRSSVLAPDAGIIWDLATSSENPDPTTWIYRLRGDVMIAKNSKNVPERPLDAEDVKQNFTRAGDPKTGTVGVRFFAGQIDSLEAVDAKTFKLKTKQPYAFVPANTGNYIYAAIAPREWLTSATLKTEAVGSGPFTVTQWEPGVGATVVRNPNYYIKGLPYLDQYQVIKFSDLVTFRTAFIAGQVDLYSATNADESKQLQNDNKNLLHFEDPSFSYLSFWMNTRNKPWDDPRARRAAALGVNRQEFIQLLGHGQGDPIGPVTAPMKQYALPQDELAKLQPFDPQQAKALFQQAGVTEFTVVHATAGVIADYVNIFVRQLAAVGVTVKADPQDPGAAAQGLFQNKHPSSILIPPEFTDPDFSLHAYASKGPIGSGNYDTGFSDPEVDAAVAKAAQQLDQAERTKAYQEAQRIIMRKDPAWFNFFAGRNNVLAQPYVRGIRQGIGTLGTAFIKEYWLAK